MSALEREILEKFHQLQPAAKRRIWSLLEQEMASEVAQQNATFDYAAWINNVESIRQQIRATNGTMLPAMDIVEMLRDIRDGEDE